MKFKKAFAVILAVAMVITLMPTMAFATTDSTKPTVQTVAKNTEFTSVLEFEITNDPTRWTKDPEDKFKIVAPVTLNLTGGAKWCYDSGKTSSTLIKDALDSATSSQNAIEVEVAGKTNVISNVEFVSGNTIKLTFKQKNYEQIAKGDIIKLTLHLKSTNTAGPVQIAVASDNGQITDAIFDLANVVAGDTTATVSATDDNLELVTIRKTNQAASDILIKEVYAGAVSASTSQSFTLRLPKNVSWNTATTIEGNLIGGTVTVNASNITNDGRDLNVTFTASTLSTGGNVAARTLTIHPVVDTTKDTEEGNLTVDLIKTTGDISSASNLVIAKIVERAVSVYVDENDYTDEEIPALYSGMTPDVTDEDNVAIITIKENKAGKLTTGKYIDFTFDSSVQLAGLVKYSINGTAKVSDNLDPTNAGKNVSKDRSTFGWEVNNLVSNEANEVKFYIPITVEAGFEGDVECVVSGAAAGIDEDVSVVVATAKPVLKVVAEVSEVRTGMQNQKINDIALTETEAGALEDVINTSGKHDVTVELPFTLAKDATVEVTEGDLKIDKITAKKGTNTISFGIDKASKDTASTITISGLEIDLNRVPAEGGYDIKTYGDAVIDNGDYNDDAFADTYVSEDAIEIITPADPSIVDNKINATFVVGESQYSNNGVTVAMDVASFIQNDRTYVPVRYLANALGVTDENIAWSEGARTVTLTGPNTVVKLTVGSNIITTSTGTITADVPVIIQNDRTYLPARFVANAFGADVAWNGTTRTVTITR